MKVLYSPYFQKSFKKLPPRIQKLTAAKEKIFKDDCFHPSLKTHPLKGRLKGYFSFSVNYQYHILFKFKDKQTAIFINIGTHSIYK